MPEIISRSGPFYEVKFRVRIREGDHTIYLSGDFNCFGQGDLRFSRINEFWEANVRIFAGDYRYYILRNQYEKIDEEGKEVKRWRKLHLPLDSPYHDPGDSRFCYQSGGIAILTILAPKNDRNLSIMLQGELREVLKPQIVSMKTYDLHAFYVRGNGKYHFQAADTTYPVTKEFYLSTEYAENDSTGSGIMYHIFPDRFLRSSQRKESDRTLLQWGSKPRRTSFFGGDLNGIALKLDYLRDALNVEYLYLNPVSLSKTNHRYDTDDYYTVDPLLGTNDDVRSLAGNLHSRGMKLIMDAVFNHTSTTFPMFRDIMDKSGKSRYLDWYIFHRSEFNVFTGTFKFGTGTDIPAYETFLGVGSMPKLNHYNTEVVDYIKSVCRYYLDEFGADGLRYDVGHSVPSGSINEIRKFLNAPEHFLHIGETWCRSPHFVGSDYYDSITNYPIGISIISLLKGRITIDDFLGSYLQDIINYGNRTDIMMNVLDSHDTPRLLNLLSHNQDRFMAAYSILFALNGISTIYYGDEAGLDGGKDPDCRKCYPWGKENGEILDFFSKITHLRATNSLFRNGVMTARTGNNHFVISKLSSKGILEFVFAVDKVDISFRGELLYSHRGRVDGDMLRMEEDGFAFIAKTADFDQSARDDKALMQS